MNALMQTKEINAIANNIVGGDFFLDLNAFDLKNKVENTKTDNMNISKT